MLQLLSRHEDADISSGDVINSIRARAKRCYDVISLKSSAFNIKLIRRKQLATRRAFYLKQLKNQTMTPKLASVSLPSSPLQKMSFKRSANLVMSASMKIKNERLIRKESTKDWIRRRSSQLLGLASKELEPDKNVIKMIQSEDASKLVIVYADAKVNPGVEFMEIIDFSRENQENSQNLIRKCIKSPVQGFKLAGVSNSGKRLLFYEVTIDKPIFDEETSPGIISKSNFYPRMETFSISGVSFDVIIFNQTNIFDCFYLESVQTLIAIGRRGQVFKIDLSASENRGSLTNIAVSESVNVSSAQKKVTIISASVDTIAGYVWINALASAKDQGSNKNNQKSKQKMKQLIILEIGNLDVYNLIEMGFLLDADLAFSGRQIISSTGVAFMANQIDIRCWIS